jgi:iron-sulfur cluster assembly protein
MDIPVTITDKAFEEIMKIRATKKIPEKYGLRVGVKGGGCAGVSYLLGFDTATGDDGTFDFKGLQVHVSKQHTMHLIGLTLDFYEGSDAKGFMFSRPNQAS